MATLSYAIFFFLYWMQRKNNMYFFKSPIFLPFKLKKKIYVVGYRASPGVPLFVKMFMR